jgi:hypothetical protein
VAAAQANEPKRSHRCFSHAQRWVVFSASQKTTQTVVTRRLRVAGTKIGG